MNRGPACTRLPTQDQFRDHSTMSLDSIIVSTEDDNRILFPGGNERDFVSSALPGESTKETTDKDTSSKWLSATARTSDSWQHQVEPLNQRSTLKPGMNTPALKPTSASNPTASVEAKSLSKKKEGTASASPLAPSSTVQKKQKEVDFYQNPTILSRLILNQKYRSAIERVHSHPEETKIWLCIQRNVKAVEGVTNSSTPPTLLERHSSGSTTIEVIYSLRELPLHMACAQLVRTRQGDDVDASSSSWANDSVLNELITSCIVANPEGAYQPNHEGRLPVVDALHYGVRAETMALFLMADPVKAMQSDPQTKQSLSDINQVYRQVEAQERGMEKQDHPTNRDEIQELLELGVDFWKRAQEEASLRLRAGNSDVAYPCEEGGNDEEEADDESDSDSEDEREHPKRTSDSPDRRQDYVSMKSGLTSIAESVRDLAKLEIAKKKMGQLSTVSSVVPLASPNRDEESFVSVATRDIPAPTVYDGCLLGNTDSVERDASIHPTSWSQLEQRSIAMEQMLTDMHENNFLLNKRITEMAEERKMTKEVADLHRENVELSEKLEALQEIMARTIGLPSEDDMTTITADDDKLLLSAMSSNYEGVADRYKDLQDKHIKQQENIRVLQAAFAALAHNEVASSASAGNRTGRASSISFSDISSQDYIGGPQGNFRRRTSTFTSSGENSAEFVPPARNGTLSASPKAPRRPQKSLHRTPPPPPSRSPSTYADSKSPYYAPMGRTPSPIKLSPEVVWTPEANHARLLAEKDRDLYDDSDEVDESLSVIFRDAAKRDQMLRQHQVASPKKTKCSQVVKSPLVSKSPIAQRSSHRLRTSPSDNKYSTTARQSTYEDSIERKLFGDKPSSNQDNLSVIFQVAAAHDNRSISRLSGEASPPNGRTDHRSPHKSGKPNANNLSCSSPTSEFSIPALASQDESGAITKTKKEI